MAFLTIVALLISIKTGMHSEEVSQQGCEEGFVTTRSVCIGGGQTPSKSVTEIHKCAFTQQTIPDLPVALVDHVGVLIENTKLLVCGGTDFDDHDPRTCLTHSLGSDKWEVFPHVMNQTRIDAHAKVSDNRVIVIGGKTSDPNEECRKSQEVFSLKDPGNGWVSEEVTTKPNDKAVLCFNSDVILAIPCT